MRFGTIRRANLKVGVRDGDFATIVHVDWSRLVGALVNPLIALLGLTVAVAVALSWTPAEGRAPRTVASVIIPVTTMMLWALAALLVVGMLASAGGELAG
jgi:hypothetical protein